MEEYYQLLRAQYNLNHFLIHLNLANCFLILESHFIIAL